MTRLNRIKALVLMLIAGTLIATGSPAAPAAAACCPYTGCVDTVLKVRGPETIKRGTAPDVEVKVSFVGDGRVRGDVDITFTRVKTGRTKSVSTGYNRRGFKTVTGPTLGRRGEWRVKARFHGCPFLPSSDAYTLRVHR